MLPVLGSDYLLVAGGCDCVHAEHWMHVDTLLNQSINAINMLCSDCVTTEHCVHAELQLPYYDLHTTSHAHDHMIDDVTMPVTCHA